MLSDKMNDRIDYITHTVRELIHEGFRYWNYTACIICTACTFVVACMEAAPDLYSIERIMLNEILNIVMPIGTGIFLFRDISRFLFSYNRNTGKLVTSIIRYIFYHVLTLLLFNMMAIETVTSFVLTLIPVGAIITIFVYAMVLLLTGKNKTENNHQ